MNLLVTGGCGFIGSNFIKLIAGKEEVNTIINLDKLTYASDLNNLKPVEGVDKHILAVGDISNYSDVYDLFKDNGITHVVHFAAETHVDNSIASPVDFVYTNVVGTYNLLECSRRFGVERFHHVSTDEVYGELDNEGKFSEETPYNPQNPYSATKASSDFLVRSYGHTFGVNYTISNCSNNYGPHQNFEKFIPVVIKSLLEGSKVPVYGEGKNVRDWIHVEDHGEAIWDILTKGKNGNTYLVGANNEKTNLQIVEAICRILNLNPQESIEFVEDRAGHDFRYAIDASKLEKELQWSPKRDFEAGLKETIEWYTKNQTEEL